MVSRSQPRNKTEDTGPAGDGPPPYRLLLIDDDEDYHILTRSYLDEVPFATTLDWVDNYEDAVEAILADEHDVYLIDHFLGEHTGIDLLGLVRERGCRAPMIILTGRDGDGMDAEALDAGATDYLEKKNLNRVTLGRAIRYAYSHQSDQNQLKDQANRLTRLEQLKTDMIRIAAHDLRTPLTVMRGYLEILNGDLADSLDDTHAQYLNELQLAVRRMQRMVGDILSLERIALESGGYTTPVDFTALVQEVYDEVARHNTHRLTLHLAPQPITVYGSEPELREALKNLLGNAVKYTPAGGNINVTLSADTDVTLFTVEDSGYGIPEDQQKSLFKPFFRAKIKETRLIEGTGLGLHLVKNIIERHQGHIHFESVYGEGSTFGFMLPQMESEN